MIAPLQWRTGVHADAVALQNFECAQPPTWQYDSAGRGRWHPRVWELDVQSYFRSRCLPPLPYGDTLLVGTMDEQLVALVRFSTDDLPDTAFIYAVGVSNPWRHMGYGREAVEVALSEIRKSEAFNAEAELYVRGRVHQRNHASKSMLEACGFACVDEGQEGEPLEEWATYLPPDV